MGSTTGRMVGGWTLALALLAPLAASAQKMAVAPGAQPATFEKIFGYDRALGDRSKLQVLIVADAATPALTELEGAFRSLGIRAERVAPGALASRLAPGVVVYLTAESATPALLEQVARAKVLSIGGDPALAEAGRVGVALGDAGGKPEIVVNLDRVTAEGHDFAAQMLKVSRVVRPSGGAQAGAVQPPVLMSITKPEYPAVARRMGVQGDVVMRLQVDASGAVTGVEMIKGVSETAGIDAAALRAARTAKFKPGTLDGKPVPSSYTLTVPFRL